jgi:7,8-dihydropterin-6-yl-methyl-4-(beta-D-ribofuranosyl)aminobenzene 5'-phosphate synthase
MITITCLVEDTPLGLDFRAEHGLSFSIQVPGHQVLFDTGESGDVLLHNARQLEINLAQIDALALSHAHLDHSGGVPDLLKLTPASLPFFASPDVFRPRYVHEDRASYGMPLSRAELAQQVDLHLSADPVEMVPGVWTTGEITERPYFEGRGATHQIKVNGEWQPDPYRDDLSLVVEDTDGVIVVLGCGHAGLLNILRHVKRHFARPIKMVIGGTHLNAATDDMLAQAVAELRDTYGSPRLYPNHCTGQHAYDALAAAFGDRVQPCPAGTVVQV